MLLTRVLGKEVLYGIQSAIAVICSLTSLCTQYRAVTSSFRNNHLDQLT